MDEELIEQAFEIGKPSVSIGEKIADDCFLNGLQKGEIIKLNDIENYINQGNYFVPQAVLYGFVQRMKRYIELNDIQVINFEGGERVYVHKNYANAFIKKIMEYNELKIF